MSFRTWLLERKLARLASKMKRAHVRQRHLREKLSRLADDRRRLHMTDEAYEAKRAALEAEKHALTERVNALSNEESATKTALAQGAEDA